MGIHEHTHMHMGVHTHTRSYKHAHIDVHEQTRTHVNMCHMLYRIWVFALFVILFQLMFYFFLLAILSHSHLRPRVWMPVL